MVGVCSAVARQAAAGSRRGPVLGVDLAVVLTVVMHRIDRSVAAADGPVCTLAHPA